MSELVKKFLEHFKNPDSINLPLPVPDPMPMPDREYPLLVRVSTTDVKALGVSRLKIANLTSDIVEMKVSGCQTLNKKCSTEYFFPKIILPLVTGPLRCQNAQT